MLFWLFKNFFLKLYKECPRGQGQGSRGPAWAGGASQPVPEPAMVTGPRTLTLCAPLVVLIAPLSLRRQSMAAGRSPTPLSA